MAAIQKNRWWILLLILLILCALLFWMRSRATNPERPEEESREQRPSGDVSLPSPEDVPTGTRAGAIRISELMVRNKSTLPDAEGEFPDWIELENISEETVDLSGWRLAEEGKKGWSFPQTLLPAGERLLIFASGKELPGHCSFSLSAGETLVLYDPNGAQADRVLCPEGEADRAWLPDGAGGCTESLYPTPGYPNTAEGYESLMAARDCGSPLLINELCPYNRSGDFYNFLGESDWLELKNVSGETLRLSDYYLSDDEDAPLLYRLPEQELEPGGIFLLRCDTEGIQWGAVQVCTAFNLGSTAEHIYLHGADGTLLDYASVRDVPCNGSYGRMPGENGWFFFLKPTPGQDNADGARRVSAQPLSAEPDGVFNDVEGLTVTLSSPGKIYYTTDGSYPTTASAVYTGPIRVEETQILRAIAVEDNALPSRALTLSYILNENHSLPVLSLVTDDPRFRGMYYGGKKGLELRGSLSLYEEGGSFTIPCGIKMHGETSLELAKKNMSVRFRGAYGQAELHYDIYGGGVTDFESLLLRAGQDYFHAIIRNELCTELALQASDNIVASRSRYCVLYVDGKYFGIYALEEKLNEAMYAHLAGVSKDSVTVDQPPLYDANAMYQEVYLYVMENDPADPDCYAELCRRLDVDSLIDWIILEGCFANSDLTYGNVRYCRSTENDGRWRVMFYDLDGTFNTMEQVYFNLLSPYAREGRQVAKLIARLLRSGDFRAALFRRANELLRGPLATDRILEEIDVLAAQVDPEVARDYGSYQMSKDSREWNVNWLRNYIRDWDWSEMCIERLCYYLNATDEEKALYFGK